VFPAKAEESAELWLPYTQDQLDRRWPDALRSWPERWRSNKGCAASQLVRTLDLVNPSKRRVAQVARAMTAQQPPLRAMTLSMRSNGLEAELAAALLAAPPPTLTTLTLGAVIMKEQASWQRISASPALAGLKHLALRGCALPASGLEQLAAACGRLEVLEILGERMADNAAALARCELPALRELQLRRIYTPWSRSGEALTAEGLAELVEASWFGQLERLRLTGDWVAQPLREALRQHPRANPRLTISDA
jgi:hypothetical protein